MPGWTPTGNLDSPREGHTATLLPNGTVLVCGGIIRSAGSGTVLSTAELFHPGTGTWTPTDDAFYARSFHSATLLPNGKVLVVGGIYEAIPPYTPNGTELYDPATGRWAVTASLNVPRQIPAVTPLSDGRVLVVGGRAVPDYGSAEIYDPVTANWIPTGSLVDGRPTGTATLLMDGRVLAVGGYLEAQLYDPATGVWTLTGSNLQPRNNHTVTRLNDGTVLVAGGLITQPRNISTNTAEIYDPTSGMWSAVGNLNVGRYSHTATLLPNGTVLVVGGMHIDDAGGVPLKSTELYDPATQTWLLADDLGTGRYYHTETLLRVRHPEALTGFRVLVAGGDDARRPPDDFASLSTTELFSSGPPVHR
jgi:hypothetical protein